MMLSYHIIACSREPELVTSDLPYSTFVQNMLLFFQQIRAMLRFYSAKLCYAGLYFAVAHNCCCVVGRDIFLHVKKQ